MTLEQVRKLSPGIYTVIWKSGGSSKAAIGVMANGDKWLAPTNWIAPTTNIKVWRLVDYVK